jgi:hypothetical protein
MKKLVCTLAVISGCLISGEVETALRPTPLTSERTTTLHVSELAVLHIPSDARYLHSVNAEGPNGSWRDVLVLVRRSRRDVTFRAARAGKGVIILSPDVPSGECISCATTHYFIEVVSQR